MEFTLVLYLSGMADGALTAMLLNSMLTFAEVA